MKSISRLRLALILTVMLVGIHLSGTPASASGSSSASILLHVTPSGVSDPCALAPSATFRPTTAAPVDPNGQRSYFVYVMGADPGASDPGIAGMQFGIEYGAVGPGKGLRVDSFVLCASLQFPSFSPIAWPQSGSGNLITWDPVTRCQRQPIAVAGYFYLTAYSPATMSLTTRPTDDWAKLANCGSDEIVVYPGRLGWASFGGAGIGDDHDGFDPTHDMPHFTRPELRIVEPAPGARYANDDLTIRWSLIDDKTSTWLLNTTWRLDQGAWQLAPGTGALALRDVAPGDHLFQIRSVDPEGEVGADSVSFTIIRYVNELPTTVLLTQPGPVDIAAGGPYRFSWTGTDSRTPTANLRYDYVLVETQYRWCSEPTPELRYAASETSVEFASLPTGVYVFTVAAVDEDGIADPKGATSRTLSVYRPGLPTCPPLVHFTSEPHDSLWINTPLLLTWRGFHGDGPHEALRFSWQINEGDWSPWLPDTTAVFEFSEPATYRIRVRGRDAGGFQSTYLYRVLWDVIERPVLPPPDPDPDPGEGGGSDSVLVAPNPSPSSVGISFRLDEPMSVRYRIFDIHGKLIRECPMLELSAGAQQLAWDGLDSSGRPAASGAYFMELTMGAKRLVRSLRIVR